MMNRSDAVAVIESTSEAIGMPVQKFRLAPRQGHARRLSHSISIPRVALTLSEAYCIYYICHELAHLVVFRLGCIGDSCSHGPIFKREEQRLCKFWGVEITGYDSPGSKGAYPRRDQVRMI